MKASRSAFIGVYSILMIVGAMFVPTAGAQSTSAEEAQLVAQEAYIYLYPLVLMDLTRKQLTNIDPKINPIGGPDNVFVHIRAYPTAEMRAVVRPTLTLSTQVLGSI